MGTGALEPRLERERERERDRTLERNGVRSQGALQCNNLRTLLEAVRCLKNGGGQQTPSPGAKRQLKQTADGPGGSPMSDGLQKKAPTMQATWKRG